jgi:hypothetical protein
MLQVLYISHCAIPENEMEVEIRGILSKSVENNRRDNITGLFLLVENRFLQLLEGDDSVVLACLERIRKDPRHSDFKVMVQKATQARLFPEWSMHFFRLSDQEALQKLGVHQLSDLGISSWQEGFQNNLSILLMESFARLGVKKDPELD